MQYMFDEGCAEWSCYQLSQGHGTFPSGFDPDESTLVAKETKFVIDGFMRLEWPSFVLFVVSMSFNRI
jgi:hypothetical protein